MSRKRSPHTFRVRVEFTMESWNNIEMVAEEVCHHIRVEYRAKDIHRTVTDLTLRNAPSASGGDDACKTRTVHGCWCDLPNGHDGPHRSYDDPEPAPATGGDEARCLCGQTVSVRNKNGIWAWPKGHAGYWTEDGCRQPEARCERCGGKGGWPEGKAWIHVCPACKGTGRVK